MLVAAITGWLLWEKGSGEAVRQSERSPLTQMFQPGALPDFFLSSTDARPDSIVYTLTNREWVAKIEVMEHVDAADAETLLQDGIMGIQALYANALSPYPGDISNQVTTDPAFRPRLFRTTNGPLARAYFLLYANDRFGYGATTKDSVKFKSLTGWLYGKSRQEFFKVKLFAPPTTTDRDMEKMFMSLRSK